MMFHDMSYRHGRPVEVYPFALMDARTACEKDLCVFEIHYTDRVGENYFAASSPSHRWPGFRV